HRVRAPVHEAVVGARLYSRLRAHLHQRPRRLPEGPGNKRAGAADFPRRASHAARARRGARVVAHGDLGGCLTRLRIREMAAVASGEIPTLEARAEPESSLALEVVTKRVLAGDEEPRPLLWTREEYYRLGALGQIGRAHV